MRGIMLTTSAEFAGPAIEEVRELAPEPSELRSFGEGVFFWPTELPEVAVRRLLSHPPIFLHHLHRVSASWPFENALLLAQQVLQRLSDDLSMLPAGATVAMQGRSVGSDADWRPRDLKQLVDQLLATRGFAPTVKSPQWIISLTLADGEVYYGLAPASENLSDWTGGMVHFRKSPEDVSRSMFKLLEAIERWHLELAPGSAALDLGAAPGGWTAVLLDHGLKVTAVDTGELDSRLSDHPRLTFYRQNVKDLHLPPGNQFQWITCDMSWNPFFTVRAVNALIPHLQAGGETILTVKLMGRRPRQTIRQVIDSLDPRLSVMHALHLFHNRREITLHLRRSG